MYVDSSPSTTQRPTDSSRGRGARRHATARTVARRRRISTRAADAVVAQWLLAQLPDDHRHAQSPASRERVVTKMSLEPSGPGLRPK